MIRLATNNRRHPLSGLDSVKLATEAFQEVARQISAGRIATGEQKTPKVPIRDRRNDNWNVRGLLQVGKLSIVEKEMKDHSITTTYLVLARRTCEAVAISKLPQEIHCTSRETETRAGVSVLMPSHMIKYVLGYNPISAKIITIKLNTRPCTMNIVQVYTLTSGSSEEDINDYYELLEETLNAIYPVGK